MPWHSRLRNVFRREQLSDDLDTELSFHVEETIDRLIAEGLSEPEARWQAKRLLGNYSVQKEKTRDMDIAVWFEATAADLAYGVRQLKLNPAFAAVAILSLALGIGANTAIFQLLDAIRLSGLPVKNPAQLATVVRTGSYWLAGSYSSREDAFSYAQLDEVRKRQQAFSEMLLFWPTQFDLSVSGRSRYAEGLLVSSNYLDVLGIKPIAGRGLSTDDDKVACSSGTAILSYGFWQREYGGNLDALGKNISLNGHSFPIAGITPPSFFGVEPGQRFDVMLPLCANNVLYSKDGRGWAYNDTYFWLTPIARLKPGWSVERASAYMKQLSASIFQSTIPASYRPDMAKQWVKNRWKVESASNGVSPLRRDFSDPLWILLAISGAVLLIACANLANLLLARASAREKEIAVRQAVGASRSRLMSQLLTESALLAVSGAALGLILAQVLSRSLIAFLNGDGNSIAVPGGLNWHVFGFLAALAFLTCLLFGLVPAFRASGARPAVSMHGGRSSTASRERNALRRTLVTTQVALSLVLLVAALLFSRSLQKLLSAGLGFDPQNVLVANFTAKGSSFDTPEKRRAVFRELDNRIHAIGAVASAANAASTPFSGWGWNQGVHSDDDPSRADGKSSWFNRVGPGYFASLGAPILAGRDFNPHDDLSAPKVALVNQSLAKLIFKGKNPVGRTVRVEEDGTKPDSVYQIVGLVATTRYNDLREPEPATVFLPMAQDPQPGNGTTFVIRGRTSAESLESAIQHEMSKVSPNLLVTFHVLSNQINDSVLRDRLMANLSGAFGILAASLSALGLYGVMSYLVARRRNEIGIRFALGATRGNVYALVARDASIMVASGLLVGIVAAMLLSRYAESLLFGLKGRDPLTLILAVLLLAFTAALAGLLPARRAARLEPVAALREE